MDDRDPIIRRPESEQIHGSDALDQGARRRGSRVDHPTTPDDTRTMPLREEELVARRETRQVGEVSVHKEVERVPARMEVDAVNEEVEIRHVPVGKAVDARREPWQDGDTYVLPVYEEQLVVVKRLVLKEEVHVRRMATAERRLFEENVERERAVIADTTPEGAVRERYDEGGTSEFTEDVDRDGSTANREGPLERLARKILD